MNWDWSPWTFLNVGPIHHICDRRANKCAVAHPRFELLNTVMPVGLSEPQRALRVCLIHKIVLRVGKRQDVESSGDDTLESDNKGKTTSQTSARRDNTV